MSRTSQTSISTSPTITSTSTTTSSSTPTSTSTSTSTEISATTTTPTSASTSTSTLTLLSLVCTPTSARTQDQNQRRFLQPQLRPHRHCHQDQAQQNLRRRLFLTTAAILKSASPAAASKLEYDDLPATSTATPPGTNQWKPKCKHWPRPRRTPPRKSRPTVPYEIATYKIGPTLKQTTQRDKT